MVAMLENTKAERAVKRKLERGQGWDKNVCCLYFSIIKG